MKSILISALLCAVLVIFGGGIACGQSSGADTEIKRLKDEIQRRESVERSESIMPGDKEVNHLNLEAARARLRAFLQARIAAKQELRATLGEAITPEESRSITSALESLEALLRSLDQTSAANPSSNLALASPSLTASTAPPTLLPAGGGQSSLQIGSTDAIKPISLTTVDNSSAPLTTNSGLPSSSSSGSTNSSSTAADSKTDVLPLRSCAEVASSTAQDPKAASLFELEFCQRVSVIQRDKAAHPNSSLAGLDPRRDLQFFMIALLAREGRAQYVLAAENERVDKQVGSDASSSGSTSLVSKGSVPSILGFAVDTGALLQSSSGSTLTFRGNLAGLAKAVAGKGFISGYDEDSPAARLLRKVSFALSYDPSRGTEPGVFTGTKRQLSNYSARFDIYNKRDPRDQRFKKDWNNFLSTHSNALVAQIQASLKRLTRLSPDPVTPIPEWVDPAIQAWFVTAARAVFDAPENEVESVLKEQLNRIPTNLSADTVAELRGFDERFRPWLEGREEILAKVAKAPIVTFEYLNDRPLNAPTTSQFKFIAETGLKRWLDLTFNGSLTIFNQQPATAGVSRVRDFQFALQFDTQMGEMGLGLGKPVFSFAGRYERLRTDALAAGISLPNTEGDIAVGQLKLTIPIKNSGIKIPFSLSFANRTELLKEKEIRGNFGFTFDLDTLFAAFNPFSRR